MCETGGEGSAHPHLIVVDGASVVAVDTTYLGRIISSPSLYVHIFSIRVSYAP